jgi:drug/metabolite transporter (DMT)-like permease
MNGKSHRKAYLYAIMAVLCWSTSPTAFKLGLRYQESYQLLTAASITSVIVLGLVLYFTGRYKQLAGFSRREIGFSAFMGLLNPVSYYLILFKAYSILPAQVAQPLNMVWPIVLVIISIPMLRQRISWKSIGAMVLSFSGVVVVSLQGGGIERNPQNRLGIILALSTSVIWAFYWICNKRDKKDPVARLFLNFLFGSLCLVAVGVLRGEQFTASGPAWYTSAYVGIFEMGVTFVWWLLAMQYAQAPDRISNLVYVAPFLNLFIVRLVLHEHIYRTTVFGIILLVAGILIQNMMSRHAKQG